MRTVTPAISIWAKDPHLSLSSFPDLKAGAIILSPILSALSFYTIGVYHRYTFFIFHFCKATEHVAEVVIAVTLEQ